MLSGVTPVILTLNEQANIGRALERLRWAQEIVVVDGGSRDDTRRIAESFRGVRFIEREFDTHADQWNFAVHQTGIRTEWVLALDADYILSEELTREIGKLAPTSEMAGFRASFIYCSYGEKLRGSLYPPVTVLFRRERARYVQQGHTQRVALEGEVGVLSAPIYHDDRKPMARWLESQSRYMRIEAEKLRSAPRNALRWQDRLRLLRVVAPVAVPFYLLLLRGLILDGWAGVFYAWQRAVAEAMLSLYLIEGDIASRFSDSSGGIPPKP